ncbi:hypothetical protein [Chitinophaga nivalis]|uniref:Terpene synthase n=1 Tax=Chitinophaga nivalis TaxID=2991709 RepID=A0ABT3IUQ7_9BACT|nr:hypothetical protein [Chitinophaga nivalis]MCW3462583.1 hypothetical protein [Chitinophaga nivalis]MCW3487726.1 hypothetical protein [Chitinophaga nivalis]
MKTALRDILKATIKERIPFSYVESMAVRELESKFRYWCEEEISRFHPHQNYFEISYRVSLYCYPRIDMPHDLLFSFMKWLAVIFFIDDKVVEDRKNYFTQGYSSFIHNTIAEDELVAFYIDQARSFMHNAYATDAPHVVRVMQHWMSISVIEDVITSTDFENKHLMNYIRMGTIGMYMLFEVNKTLLLKEGKSARTADLEVYRLGAYAVALINDLYSYKKELNEDGTEIKGNAYIRQFPNTDFDIIFNKALEEIIIVFDKYKTLITPYNQYITESVLGQLIAHDYLDRYS